MGVVIKRRVLFMIILVMKYTMINILRHHKYFAECIHQNDRYADSILLLFWMDGDTLNTTTSHTFPPNCSMKQHSQAHICFPNTYRFFSLTLRWTEMLIWQYRPLLMPAHEHSSVTGYLRTLRYPSCIKKNTGVIKLTLDFQGPTSEWGDFATWQRTRSLCRRTGWRHKPLPL